MTITYEVFRDLNYTDFVMRVDLPDGPVYGRTAFDPDAERPSTGNPLDRLPLPILGVDGNIYALQVSQVAGVYTVDLMRWVTTWNGADPQPSSSVAQAVVGGDEPTYYDPAVGYLIPGGDSVQGFFGPGSLTTHNTLLLCPGEVPQVFTGGALPIDDGSDNSFSDAFVVGRVPGGLLALAVGANLV